MEESLNRRNLVGGVVLSALIALAGAAQAATYVYASNAEDGNITDKTNRYVFVPHLGTD